MQKVLLGKYTGDLQNHKVQFRVQLPLQVNKFGAFSLSLQPLKTSLFNICLFFEWLQKKIQGDMTSNLATDYEQQFL